MAEGQRSGRRPRSILNGSARQTYGVIVSGLDADGGPLVRHATGLVVESLREAVRGMVRVLSISSPETIYRDLQGTRSDLYSSTTGDGRTTASSVHPRVPEPHFLARIGRADLWRPAE